MERNEAEVIIVGGGPVGLSLACDLSNRGVKTILLERNKTTAVIAKAFALNTRSLEIFRRMGLQEKIENASLPRDIPINIGIYSTVATGSVEVKASFSSWGDIADGKQNKGYPFYEEGVSPVIPMFCAQCSSEPVLKKHIETTSDCVQLLFGHRAVSISQDEKGVLVEATIDEEDETKIFKGQYLVACDGGSSPSRKLLGAHLYGKFVVARAVSVMFNSPQMYEQIKNESKIGFLSIMRKSYAAISYVVNDKGDIVIHVILAPNTSDAEIAEYVNNPERTVRTILGYSCSLSISASSSYQMHALLSTKSRIDKVIFAGDSAHQWLPAGGLGLNTGLSDVGDLGWKLEAAVKGFGGSNILDSYEEERRPLVDMTRRYALNIGGNLIDNKKVLMMFSIPIVKSVLSWAVVRFLLPRLFESNLLTLGFQYSNSSIIMHEYDKNGDIVTPLSYSRHRYPALPGCRAPHVRLSDHETILDLFGTCFVLLAIGGVDTDLQYLKEELKKRNVPYQQISLSKSSKLVAAYDRKYFLVRPDGIICWRSDSQPSSLESAKIVATVIGDNPRQRLPLPVTRLQVPTIQFGGGSILPPFVSDIILRYGISMVLSNFFQVSHIRGCLISIGVLLMFRTLMVKQFPQFIQETSRHSAVVIQKFGGAESVLTINTRHTGSFGPHDVLIQVHAASVNLIDCQVRRGHASFLLTKLLSPSRKSVFPLVLGRDCAGEIVAVGDAVTKFFPGDSVFAVVPFHEQGTHAQLVSVNEDFVFFKPSNVDFNEAASLPLVACSAWSALVKNANLNQHNCRGKKIIICGEVAGVSIFSIQLLKAWGADVTVMCSAQSVPLARLLGADIVINDTSTDFSSTGLGKYDIILDASGIDSKCILKSVCNGKYLSLISPYMLLSQKFGLFIGGLFFSWIYRFKVIVNRILFQRSFYYTTTEPDGECLAVVKKMVEKGEIRPMIEAVYSMDEIIAAHKHVEAGCSRGQIIVAMP